MDESNNHDIAFANTAPPASSSLPEVMDESQLLITADQLLAHYRDTGSHSTFEQLVKRYAPLVFSECISVTRNRHDAEDAAQAAFLTLAVHARGQTDIRKLGPWLQQVARRVALDQQKAKRRRTAREQKHHRINGYDQVATPELEGLDKAELRVAIQEELKELPTKYRLPLILHYFGGMSRDQMAKELNCKSATLGVRIFRAREMLGKRLKKRGISLTPLLLLAFLTEVVGSNITGGLTAKAGMIASAASMIHGGASTGVTATLIPEAARFLPVGSPARIALRVKAIITTAVLAASAVAGGAELVHKFATGEWIVPSLGGFTSWISNGWGTDTRPLDSGRELPGLTSHGVSDATPTWPAVEFPQSVNKSGNTTSDASFSSTPQPVVASSAGSRTTLLLPSLNNSARISTSTTLKPAAPASPIYVATVKSSMMSSQLFIPAPTSTAIRDPIIGATSYDASSAPSDRPATLSYGFAVTSGPGATVPLPIQIKPLTAADLAQLTSTISSVTGSTDESSSVSGTGTSSRTSSSGSGLSANGGTGSVPVSGLNSSSSTTGGISNGTDSGSLTSVAVGSTSTSGSTSATGSGTSAMGSTAGSTAGGVAASSGSSTGSSANGLSQAISGSAVAGGSSSAFSPSQIITRVANPGVGIIAPGQPTPSTYLYSSLDGGANLSVLKGYGSVPLHRALDESGIVVATGYGQQRTLDLSGATSIKNSISNTPGSPNGWYAISGGRLELPQIPLAVGNNNIVWGDEPGPTAPDLVNSLVMNIAAVKTAGQLSVSLLASDRSEIPSLPLGTTPSSIWQISSTTDYASMSITGRVTDLSGCLWEYDGQNWSRVATTFDPARMVFSATLDSPAEFIALLDGGVTSSRVTFLTAPGGVPAQQLSPMLTSGSYNTYGQNYGQPMDANSRTGSSSGILVSLGTSTKTLSTGTSINLGGIDYHKNGSLGTTVDGTAITPSIGPDVPNLIDLGDPTGGIDGTLANLGSSVSPGGSSVPEPAGAPMMLVAAGLGLLLRRSRGPRKA